MNIQNLFFFKKKKATCGKFSGGIPKVLERLKKPKKPNNQNKQETPSQTKRSPKGPNQKNPWKEMFSPKIVSFNKTNFEELNQYLQNSSS